MTQNTARLVLHRCEMLTTAYEHDAPLVPCDAPALLRHGTHGQSYWLCDKHFLAFRDHFEEVRGMTQNTEPRGEAINDLVADGRML